MTRPTAGSRMTRALRRLRGTRGSAVVELALALPLLLLLLVGVVEVGRGFYAYLTVVQATQQAAQLSVDAKYTDQQVLDRLRAWAAPMQLGQVTLQRLTDRTEVTARYAMPVKVRLLRTALRRDSIRVSVRAAAPREE